MYIYRLLVELCEAKAFTESKNIDFKKVFRVHINHQLKDQCKNTKR